MTEHFVLITTLVTAFGLALVFGYIAERFLKTPALVGYIISGVAVSLIPGLPAVDRTVTEQFAEIGVMLLMFGVGLHFSLNDLLRVKAVSGTGALIQMTVSTVAGCCLAMLAWGWSVPQALVFGLTLSCASTVVVMKALELRHLTTDINGQVVIGWLVVQDLVTVFIMVCLPLLAQVMNGGETLTNQVIIRELSKTFLSVVVFVAAMLIVGRRVLPWILKKVADLGSRELFTLCVLALAIGIAYGAGALFNVSYALGAFFAGMVMRESSLAHRAAQNSLPLQDAFAVLFFVSVGLLLDWHVFIEQPFTIFTILLVILFVTSGVSALLVLLLKWPLDSALTLGACVAQIGEFSFILCGQGMSLGLADQSTMSLIVAASIVSIAFNPLLFMLTPKLRYVLVTRYPFFRQAAMRVAPVSLPQSPATTKQPRRGHVIVVGYNTVARALLVKLQSAKIPAICIVNTMDKLPEDAPQGENAPMMIVGDAKDPMVLVKARITQASYLALPLRDTILNRQVLKFARQLNADLPVIVRVPDDDLPEAWVGDEKIHILTNDEAVLLAMFENLAMRVKPLETSDEEAGTPHVAVAAELKAQATASADAPVLSQSVTEDGMVDDTPASALKDETKQTMKERLTQASQTTRLSMRRASLRGRTFWARLKQRKKTKPERE